VNPTTAADSDSRSSLRLRLRSESTVPFSASLQSLPPRPLEALNLCTHSPPAVHGYRDHRPLHLERHDQWLLPRFMVKESPRSARRTYRFIRTLPSTARSWGSRQAAHIRAQNPAQVKPVSFISLSCYRLQRPNYWRRNCRPSARSATEPMPVTEGRCKFKFKVHPVTCGALWPSRIPAVDTGGGLFESNADPDGRRYSSSSAAWVVLSDYPSSSIVVCATS